MVWHTGYLKYFDLQLYDEGFVLLMPERAKPTVIPPFQPSPKIFKVQQRSEKWGEQLGVHGVGDLNECVSKGGIKELILIAEALQEERISKIADQIGERKHVKFVMIAGPSSSGKTTFSHPLGYPHDSDKNYPYQWDEASIHVPQAERGAGRDALL